MDISNLNSLEHISKNFNINFKFLEYITKKEYLKLVNLDNKTNNVLDLNTNIFTNTSKYISILKIPKKNKKNKNEYREVLKIYPPYNIFYKELLYEIENIIKNNNSSYVTDNAQGFIKGRNILSNAQKHLNKKYLQKFDIKNFFNSIKINSIYSIFIKLGCSEETSKLFSKLCTYNDELKEGLNTSPMLANLYCYDLDNELINLSNKYRFTYTRYSDDITFSSNTNNFPDLEQIKSILKKYSLELNSNKTLFTKHGQSQYVTGLSISNSLYPRVPKRLKRKIRQDLYQLEKYFHEEKVEIEYKLRQVYGKIVYTMGIEKDLGKKYKKKFLDILYKNGYKLNEIFEDSPKQLVNQVFHYTDESDIKINGKHYLALSVISIFTEDLKEDNKNKLTILKESIVNDLRNGLTSKQKNNIFHHTSDNTYVKEQYQRLLRTLDFEAFIIFIDGNSENMRKIEYQNAYYKIFDIIFYKILRRFKQYNNYLYPEENSKISINKLEENLKRLQGIPKFTINKATKNEILLSMPDYILGIFRDCIKEDLTEKCNKLKTGQTLNQANKLNEILDKIRLVIDVSNKKYYARQNHKRLNCMELNRQISTNITSEEKELDEKKHKINYSDRLYKATKRFLLKIKRKLM
ncbi:reverse transcriptase family protein [Arcobacter sp.]|uniref:reverse transcriptase family protein n=1 Tax=Arcobacter sp. TaxID=1872629 RepID=UPI003C762D2E